ncbi:MAG: nucleotide exchange factor GrpE [Pseudomonadota bacterium]|nr:nucleotide exchange factor GrpE [Pseudomonadota bacterium]
MSEQQRPDAIESDAAETAPERSDEQAAGQDADEQANVADLEAKLADAEDRVLRVQAELQNVRRRAQLDVEKAHKFALDKFTEALLPVVDGMERGLSAVDRENTELAPFVEGLELSLRSFLDVLAKFSVEAVDPTGEPFDPQLHEAIAMVESTHAEPGSVLDVVQKGYTLNGRLLRPARVAVAKAPGVTGVNETA